MIWSNLLWSVLFGVLGAALGWLVALLAGRLWNAERGKLYRGAIMIALAVAGVVAGQLAKPLRIPPRSDSRVAASLNKALEPILAQPELQERFGQLSRLELRAHCWSLSVSGVRYLSPRDLELWASFRTRLAASSPAACAAMWTGGDGAAIARALDSLSDEELKAWAELHARAAALSLEQAPAALGADEGSESSLEDSPAAAAAAALSRGRAAAVELLPAEARPAFEADAVRADLSEARACEMFQALLAGAKRLDPALRSEFYRALSSRHAPAPAPVRPNVP